MIPAIHHPKEDIRGAATKILQEVQKQTKAVTLQDIEVLPEKLRDALWEKLQEAASNGEPSQVKERQKKVNVVNVESDA